MVKSNVPVEVVEDSDNEAKSAKKKTSGGEDEESQGEEEYEIEGILDAKHGAFPGGRMGFLVKWKGYGNEHNSWVDQADAGNAQDLIDEFWEKRKKQKKSKPKEAKGRPRKSGAKDDSPPDGSASKRKKSSSGPKSNSQAEDGMDEDEDEEKPAAKKPKKIARAKETNEGMDVDEDADEIEYKPMEKYRNQKSWENLVAHVDTIEKMDGVLKVFFTLNNGDKVVESSQECAKHFPQKLIQFYESNLRWRETE